MGKIEDRWWQNWFWGPREKLSVSRLNDEQREIAEQLEQKNIMTQEEYARSLEGIGGLRK